MPVLLICSIIICLVTGYLSHNHNPIVTILDQKNVQYCL